MFTIVNAIIFSRIWNPALIRIALDCASKHCKNCRVIHFHDDKSDVGWEDAVDVGEQFKVALQYTDSIPERAYSCYKGLQTSCLARWKVLSDWMEANNVDEVFHCDSDVLLFDDPFKSPHYKHGSLMLSDNMNGTCHAGHSLIPRNCVKEFWPMLHTVVADDVCKEGHLSDMLIWTKLGRIHGFINQNQILDGVAFDHHLGVTEDWENDGGKPQAYKTLTWKDGKPHCKYLPTGEYIRLLNLHCWGASENLMESYAKFGGIT